MEQRGLYQSDGGGKAERTGYLVNSWQRWDLSTVSPDLLLCCWASIISISISVPWTTSKHSLSHYLLYPDYFCQKEFVRQLCPTFCLWIQEIREKESLACFNSVEAPVAIFHSVVVGLIAAFLVPCGQCHSCSTSGQFIMKASIIFWLTYSALALERTSLWDTQQLSHKSITLSAIWTFNKLLAFKVKPLSMSIDESVDFFKGSAWTLAHSYSLIAFVRQQQVNCHTATSLSKAKEYLWNEWGP